MAQNLNTHRASGCNGRVLLGTYSWPQTGGFKRSGSLYLIKSLAPIEARVHPRACGGNIVAPQPDGRERGPSPCMRGKRSGTARPARPTGSIPAHAGETDAGSVACGDDHARHLGQCDRKHGDFPLITTRCITACSPPTAVQRQQLTQDFVVGDVGGSRDGQGAGRDRRGPAGQDGSRVPTRAAVTRS